MTVEALPHRRNASLRPADMIGSLLHKANQKHDAKWAAGQVTPRQARVLMAVAEDEGCSQTDLVDRTGVDRSTLADIVRRLNKRKMVKRRRTEKDARMYSVTLTDEGRKLTQEMAKKSHAIGEEFLSPLSANAQSALINALQVVVDAP